MGNSHARPVVVTNEVALEHFKLLRVVGKGAFGKVRIVERKDSGLTFALKYIRKDGVVRTENVRNIIRERKMLENLNHPFLCNLRYSFQDFEYLYLVVDLMTGGDLRFHIDRKTFTEDTICFWMAQLGCAVRYIHERGVIHRDIKPDNILLDSEGHIHLADFNVAAEIVPGKLLTSRSGTLAYLAPEVYDGKGYSYQVDWWSLGVVFYECIYSKRPFEGHSESELSTSVRAMAPSYPLTNPPVSKSCEDAMQSLLCERKSRIGALGFDTFTGHSFWKPLNFEKLESKQIPPIFVPSSEKANFDATHDLEELLLEEAPLEARVRRNKPRAQPKAGATAKEVRAAELYKMIEELFEPFDYTLAAYDSTHPVSTGGLALEADSEGANPDVPALLVDETAAPDSYDDHHSQSSGAGTPPLTSQISLPMMRKQACSNAAGQDMPAGKSSQIASKPISVTSSPQSISRPRNPRTKSETKQTGSLPRASESVSNRPLANSLVGSGSRSADPRPPRSSGFLGFLAKKKARDVSQKGRHESGVLGREGARTVVH